MFQTANPSFKHASSAAEEFYCNGSPTLLTSWRPDELRRIRAMTLAVTAAARIRSRWNVAAPGGHRVTPMRSRRTESEWPEVRAPIDRDAPGRCRAN